MTNHPSFRSDISPTLSSVIRLAEASSAVEQWSDQEAGCEISIKWIGQKEWQDFGDTTAAANAIYTMSEGSLYVVRDASGEFVRDADEDYADHPCRTPARDEAQEMPLHAAMAAARRSTDSVIEA